MKGRLWSVDIDVHQFGMPARTGFHQMKGSVETSVVDSAFVIEGRDDRELNEQVLCCARLSKLGLKNCTPFPKILTNKNIEQQINKLQKMSREKHKTESLYLNDQTNNNINNNNNNNNNNNDNISQNKDENHTITNNINHHSQITNNDDNNNNNHSFNNNNNNNNNYENTNHMIRDSDANNNNIQISNNDTETNDSLSHPK